jgi:hypothetical protein
MILKKTAFVFEIIHFALAEYYVSLGTLDEIDPLIKVEEC